ncbi:MAG: hypothetical protein AAGF85_14570 [Bacteroidota bacterium]
MKTVLIFLLSFLVVVGGSFAQCNPYFDLQEGSKWEITNYSGKGKFQGKQQSEIKTLETGSNGWKATMATKIYDKKNKIIYDKDVDMACDNGVVTLDLTRLIPDEQLQTFKDMNMQVEMDNIEVPEKLETGMILDNGSVTISGDLPMTMTVTITDRKVEGIETITTPAGSFECYKISYNVGTKMLTNMKSTGVDFIAEGVGMVRNETYSKSGKLIGYSELTSR